MKKFCITFLALTIIFLSLNFCGCDLQKKEYLRIHIRANSNLRVDQDIKMEVKDLLVEFLTPYLVDIHSKEKAISFLKSNLKKMEELTNEFLTKSGFNYSSKVLLRSEKFPTRIYGNLTLEEGIYDALIVELGSAEGNNWWCVVYPPLCFVNCGTNYVYKSKILEIINNFFKKI
ncbi:MAG: stage II sporulation protein R [Clostridia bacterium]|nr:stage II sporulation protein R [Clostridia bacterium]